MPRYKTQNLTVYNSLSGQKEVFRPLKEGYVGLYVCGPTVYSNVHLGNCRTFISFDMMFRYLQHLNYKVRYVRNITDVGHLENDADDGEDKIAKKAKLEQLEPMEIAQRYTVDFHQTLQKFNILPPSIEPIATGHIIEQIAAVQRILQKGFAYEVNGSVYFDVIRFNQQHTYGKLSGRNPEDMLANTRTLNAQDEKRNPQDFALWKKASPQHLMRWPSPWGEGFPGWHLECTTMSTKYLGDTFDIHGGGMDLKFPHHDCEIAQAEADTGASPANYWLHANMLTLNGRKMAKSTGNHLSPSEVISGENDLLSKAYTPTVVRFFMMQAHYASVLDLSDMALQASEKGYQRLMEAMIIVHTLAPGNNSDFDVKAWRQECYDAMNDDFNTPILIARLFEGVKHINRVKIGEESLTKDDITLLQNTLHTFVYEVLGLEKLSDTAEDTDKLNGVMQLLIDLRNTARTKKDFAISDHIRDELATLGIQLKDSKSGTTFHIE